MAGVRDGLDGMKLGSIPLSVYVKLIPTTNTNTSTNTNTKTNANTNSDTNTTHKYK